MEVILLERIEKLGQMGDVVTVKPGYARNYLLPQRKALRATEGNRSYFEGQRGQLEAENLERRKEAEAVGGKLDGLTVSLIRQAGDSGQLYGSVSARDIAETIGAAGFTIGRNQVGIDRPIKDLGLHAIRINLHPEVAVTVTINVARTEDEAKTQLAHGQSITRIEEAAEAAERAVEIADEALAIADDPEAELRAAEPMLEEDAGGTTEEDRAGNA